MKTDSVYFVPVPFSVFSVAKTSKGERKKQARIEEKGRKTLVTRALEYRVLHCIVERVTES